MSEKRCYICGRTEAEVAEVMGYTVKHADWHIQVGDYLYPYNRAGDMAKDERPLDVREHRARGPSWEEHVEEKLGEMDLVTCFPCEVLTRQAPRH